VSDVWYVTLGGVPFVRCNPVTGKEMVEKKNVSYEMGPGRATELRAAGLVGYCGCTDRCRSLHPTSDRIALRAMLDPSA